MGIPVLGGIMDNALKWWNEHLESYISTLRNYVAFKSIAIPGKDGLPFGQENLDMLRFMISEMDKIGLKTMLIKDVFAEGKMEGANAKKSIAVACHGDVVPAAGSWQRDPFDLYQKEDHLVGRGTTDNKGAAIAVLFAFKYLKESGWIPKNDFLLRIGSAEEIGMPDVDIAFKDEKMPSLTLVPDSGFPVAYGEKASIKAELDIDLDVITKIEGGGAASVIDKAIAVIGDEEIVVLGKGRHPATPEGGQDAVLVLMQRLKEMGIKDSAIDRYISLFPDFYGSGLGITNEDDESGRLTAVVTQVKTIDRKMNCTISIRLPISSDISDVKDKLSAIEGLKIISSSNGYKVEVDDLIMGLNDIANSVYGSNKKPYVMAGGTYARLMQKAVAFGMGDPSGNKEPPFPRGEGRAHQRNESVHIERMKKGFLIYVEALQYLDRAIGNE